MADPMMKIPPHNLGAEQSVLGAMMLDHEAVVAAMDELKPEEFYTKAHTEIYSAMMQLYGFATPIDLITVTEELERRNTIQEVGGAVYLTDLTLNVPSTSNVTNYIKIIKDKAVLRRLISAANEIVSDGYGAGEDVAMILDHAEKLVFDVVQREGASDFAEIKSVLVDTVNKITEVAQQEGQVIGITTGFMDIDAKTTGLHPADFILIAARPSMGKTSLVLNIARNAAMIDRAPVAIFSLEMARDQLVQRLLSAESHVELQKIRTGELTDEDWHKIIEASEHLAQSPIYIDDTPGITVMEMRSKARRLKLEHGLKMIVIDYLQLMSGSGKTESRQQEISEISRGLKGLARELEVPVISLSQLSRAPEARTDHRPMLSDLRESGAIEQDADLVGFLYRDDYYNPETDKRNIAELIIAKQRNGPTGTIELAWLGQFTKFESLERHREEWD